MRKIVLFLLLLFICLLFIGGVGYYLLLPREAPELTSPLQPSSTPTPTPVSLNPTGTVLASDTKAIKSLIPAFYETYASCLREPPSAARGRVSAYCQVNTALTSELFIENLRQGGTTRRGVDPITCSQNPPGSASAEMVDYEAPDKAVATTVLVFGSGFAQKVPVVVVKEDTKWVVDMVNCLGL